MKRILITILVSTVIVAACKKPAGEGGNSTIKGTVQVKNYNSNFSTLLGQYPGSDVDVYIIYGDDATFGERTRSGPDGVFEFKYLRKGNYKVYVYSNDSVATVGPPYSMTNPNVNAPSMAVYKSGEITKKKETVDLGTLKIYD